MKEIFVREKCPCTNKRIIADMEICMDCKGKEYLYAWEPLEQAVQEAHSEAICRNQ